MALALGKDGDEHVGAGHFFPARRLDVDDRALDDALEAGGRLGILVVAGDQIVEFVVDIARGRSAQRVDIDVAGPHDRGRVAVVGQGQQQMFERREFMVPLVGEGHRLMQGLFEAARERRHSDTSLLFHHALQRMLVLACGIHDLRDLGLGHLDRDRRRIPRHPDCEHAA